MSKLQIPSEILRGWAIEAFRRLMSRKAPSAADVTDEWLQSHVQILNAEMQSLAQEETHFNEPLPEEINVFLQDGAIQIRATGVDSFGMQHWVQHSFPIREAVR